MLIIEKIRKLREDAKKQYEQEMKRIDKIEHEFERVRCADNICIHYCETDKNSCGRIRFIHDCTELVNHLSKYRRIRGE